MSDTLPEEKFEYEGTDVSLLEATGALYSQMMAHSDEIRDHYWEKAFESYESAAREFLFSGEGRYDTEKISEDFAEMFSNYSEIRALNKLEDGEIERSETLEEAEGETAKYVRENYDGLADVIQPDKWLQLFVTAQGGKINSEERFRDILTQTMEKLEEQYDSFKNSMDIVKGNERFDFRF